MENEKTPMAEQEQQSIAEKKKCNFGIEPVLILILGILMGVVVKTEAVKRITIGFNDYRIPYLKQSYDMDKMYKDLLEKKQSESESGNGSGEQEPSGTCGN